MGTLYLVATPIGNLEDVTFRAIRILREVKLIAAEDTRHTKKLLNQYEINTRLLSYHEHNKDTQGDKVLNALEEGDVALVSDAGTPGLSDPGYELIKAAWDRDHLVRSIPGASAPIAALVASGLPTDAFIFLGYFPRRRSERRRLLETLAEDPRTLLFFEVPHRLIQTLEDLELHFGASREVAICRELTKVHEEILRGNLQEIRMHYSKVEPRGEFTIVIAGAPKGMKWEENAVREAISLKLGNGMSRSETAREVAAVSGWKRQEVYRMTLEDQ
jgi:16S rRNA (cytidine1402-2'-O)-methyltransferase